MEVCSSSSKAHREQVLVDAPQSLCEKTYVTAHADADTTLPVSARSQLPTARMSPRGDIAVDTPRVEMRNIRGYGLQTGVGGFQKSVGAHHLLLPPPENLRGGFMAKTALPGVKEDDEESPLPLATSDADDLAPAAWISSAPEAAAAVHLHELGGTADTPGTATEAQAFVESAELPASAVRDLAREEGALPRAIESPAGVFTAEWPAVVVPQELALTTEALPTAPETPASVLIAEVPEIVVPLVEASVVKQFDPEDLTRAFPVLSMVPNTSASVAADVPGVVVPLAASLAKKFDPEDLPPLLLFSEREHPVLQPRRAT